MLTTTLIRKHISKLKEGTLFTTRELLNCGRRAAVDQTLCRLVKRGEIMRVARGLFIKNIHGAPLPSLYKIAKHKAQAFGKQIISHAQDVARQLNLIENINKQAIFAISGYSTSFKALDTTIYLYGTCSRKMCLANSKVGGIIMALWYQGKENCAKNITVATNNLNRSERQELRQAANLMPNWLRSYFHF